MSRLSAIYSLLSGDGDITGEVGTRIYPVFPPQGSTFPLIVFTPTNNNPTDQKDTTSPIDDEALQIDIYSRTALQGETIDGYVRTLLDGYEGTVSGVVFRQIYYMNSSPPDHNPDMNVFWRSSDYNMKIQR